MRLSNTPRLLVVDDDEHIGTVIDDFFRNDFQVSVFQSPKEALEVAKREHFDVFLVDRLMEGMHGEEVLEEILDHNPDSVVILITAQPEVNSAVETLQAGAYDYVIKPLDLTKLSQAIDRAIEKSRLRRENAAMQEVIRGLANAIEAKDPLTRGHTGRVARVSLTLGRYLHLTDDELRILWTASLLHDIGKIGIPDRILLKPGKLDDQERLEINKHPDIGCRILEPIAQLDDVRRCILEHHERWDGTGYPNGKAGEEIGRLSRILSIAEVFDALAHRRCYKEAWSRDRVISFFEEEAGGQFDPGLVPHLVHLLRTRWNEMIQPLPEGEAPLWNSRRKVSGMLCHAGIGTDLGSEAAGGA